MPKSWWLVLVLRLLVAGVLVLRLLQHQHTAVAGVPGSPQSWRAAATETPRTAAARPLPVSLPLPGTPHQHRRPCDHRSEGREQQSG